MESSSGALRGSNESVAYRESEWCHQREMLMFDRTRPMAARAIFMDPNQKALARR